MALRSPRLTFLLIFLLVSAGAVLWVTRFGRATAVAEPVVDAPESPGAQAPVDPELAHLELVRETNAGQVFRRAFWRNPGAADRILQAVRREWSDEHGVQRWDWYLAVDPSPELCAYLLEQNPFQLTPRTQAFALERVPDWFPQSTESWTSYQSVGAEMLILHDPDRQRLYAMGQGYGFTRATPEPAASTALEGPRTNAPTAFSGRLPNASPPTPER